MELGEKLRQARLAAGLSQRQLCGETITRNMLSQIENGAASPSMSTLRCLAERLNKPVSFFLEEEAVVSTNQRTMERAWEEYEGGNAEAALEMLGEYRAPDPVYDREYRLLEALTLLSAAEKALRQQRHRYARELLGKLRHPLPLPELARGCALLQLELGLEHAALPDLDRELMLRAREALGQEDAAYAARLLDAAQDRHNPDWCLLRGRVSLNLEQYREAAEYLTRAEERYPRETALPLEQCYRELGDFRRAYDYACKSRSFLG